MEYTVSDRTKETLDKITSSERTQEALRFIEEDAENILQKQIELTLIPAPTFHERAKAERLVEMFREEGLTDCHVDEIGNAVGVRRGTGGGKTVLVEAHIDTVFPLDTKLEIRRENGFVFCPGITDDTRGDACMLAVIRAMNSAGIETKGDIHFVGTVREEGIGAMGGMKHYTENHPELDASISVDGSGYQGIVFNATGIQTYEISFLGEGGHASGAYGKIANPLGAAGRAIAKITDLVVPEDPRTTVAVTGAYAGSYESIHAIVDKAVITLNFRSTDQGELMKLKDRVIAAVEEACREETERWGKNEITCEIKPLIDISAGSQDPHTPIVEASYEIAKFLGAESPTLEKGGATNCSRALEAGLPAVCLGAGPEIDSRCHSLEERFQEKDSHKMCQETLLLALACAGTEEAGSII